MPPSPDPTTFFPVVWTIVRRVPQGVVSTYGQVASMIPPVPDVPPEDYVRLAPKWVGEALNAVSFRDLDGQPIAPGVPWWRIINSKGGISMPAGSNAAYQQRVRLVAESVTFDVRGCVSLDVFGWDGPDDEWLQKHSLLKPKSLRKPGSPQQMTLF